MAYIYLAKLYIRHFLAVLAGLELFYILIDLLQNQKNIPDGANLAVLYVVYQLAAATKLTLPLAAALASVSAVTSLVRNSEFAALMALGMSKRQIVAPFFTVSFCIVSIHIITGMTPVGNYYDNAQALLKNARPISPQGGVFVKLDDSYIYMQKLNLRNSVAEKVKVYDFKNAKLMQITEAKSASFSNGTWNLEQPKSYVLDDVKVVPTKSSTLLSQMRGLEPNMLANITGSSTGLNLADSLRAIWILKDQTLNLDRLKNSISATVLIPFFAPAFIVFALAFAPAGGRFLSLSTYSAAMVVSALFLWGGLLALSKYLASAKSLSQLFLLFTICTLFGISAYFYRYKLEKI